MSQGNVELVQRAWHAFRAEDVPALVEMSHRDLEFVSALSALDASTYRGPRLWTRYFERMHETWEDWLIEDFRVFDAGDDRVAAVFRLIGTGRSSGVRVEQQSGLVYTLRQGKLWRMRTYLDPADALEAVGLSE
jgi:ketosteroid isomerase-like protein